MDNDLARYSPNVLAKARRVLRRDGVDKVPGRYIAQDQDSTSIFWVTASDGRTQYRVQILGEGLMSCTCTSGLNNGGEPICYHTAAVLMSQQKRGSHDR